VPRPRLPAVAALLLLPAGCRESPARNVASIEVIAGAPLVAHSRDSTAATIPFRVRNASTVVRHVAACIGRVNPAVEQRVRRRWVQRRGIGCPAIGSPAMAVRPGQTVDGAVRVWSSGSYRVIVAEVIPPSADPGPRYSSNTVRVP